MGLSSKHADLMLMKGEEEDYFEFVEEYGEEYGEEHGDVGEYGSVEGYGEKNEGEKKEKKGEREKLTEERLTEGELNEGELTEEELMAEIESKFLSMNDSEKFDFLLDNGQEFYELTGLYISELAEKKENSPGFRNFTADLPQNTRISCICMLLWEQPTLR